MEKPLDRITEAYFNKMGELFGAKVRERVHWICENVTGDRVLDVGCSQGIVSILLGREGKEVVGIDVADEAIAYANEFLEQESDLTRQNVEFIVANFKSHAFRAETLFDTIIFGEIFEHLFDPQSFMDKALELLAPNGRIIVTVPFGINDYFDHKKTYYMRDLLLLAGSAFSLIRLKPMGKWIGAIYKRKQDEPDGLQLNDDLLLMLEQSFYQVERALLETIKKKDKVIESHLKEKETAKQKEKQKENLAHAIEERIIEDNRNQLNGVAAEIAKLRERIDTVELRESVDLKQQFSDVLQTLNHTINQLNDTINQLNEEHNRLNNAVLSERMQSEIKLKEELKEAYANEERLLKQLQQTQDRLNALRQSRFGRMATMYWKVRRRFRRG